MFFQTSFILLVLTLTQEIEPKCTKISNFDNGLPSTIKELAKNDYPGALFIAWHSAFLNTVKYWPDYSNSSDLCKPFLVPIGLTYVKFSLRPRGCCVNCCLIDNIEDHLTFYYHFRNNKRKRLKLSSKKRPGKLAALGFKSNAKIIIHLHGFSEDGVVGRSPLFIAEAFGLKKEDFNVLNLDYSEVSLLPWYHQAVDNLKPTAKAVADFLIYYHKTGELNIANIHLMGISLGGQLASYIAKEVGKYKKVHRVTGLDPAAAFYISDDNNVDISKDDAEFVDVIHTSPGFYGINKSLGHTDFYLEYPPEVIRPGCNFNKLVDRGEVVDYLLCDHLRSIRLFIQTIANPYLFPVCKNVTIDANNTTEMCGYFGYGANKSTTVGDYSISTAADWDVFKVMETIH